MSNSLSLVRSLTYAAVIGSIMIKGGMSAIAAIPLALFISLALNVVLSRFRDEDNTINDARGILRNINSINK